MKLPLPLRSLSSHLPLGACLLTLVFTTLTQTSRAGSPVASAKQPTLDQVANWKEDTLNPVLDPIAFEDAIIRSEIRPVFGHQRMADDFITQGGDLQVYGIQLRWAVTDRFALMLSKGGYNVVNPGVGPKVEGWGDLQVGMKYALIDDVANEFILTGGVLLSVPTGEEAVFQGVGSGIWNIFLASEKGFGKFHLLGNVGVMAPNDTKVNSTLLHYHLQADYRLCRWFHPYIAGNGYTVLSSGKNLPIDTEGYDLVNFGSSGAEGSTQLTLGGGFRSHLTKRLDFGFGYEKAVIKPLGLLDDRFTVDFVFKF